MPAPYPIDHPDLLRRKSWSTVADEQHSKSRRKLAGNSVACMVERAGNEEQPKTRLFRVRVSLATIVQSSQFEWAAAFLILMNTVLIGVEQSQRLAGRSWTALTVCEHLFLCFFSMEIILRLLAFGPGCFRSGWIVFDFVLISISILASWIVPLFFGDFSGSVGIFMVMRSVRLLRLGRTLRLLLHFKELWMLVRGLLSSACTILYTLLLLTVIIFMFASLGIELITTDPEADPTDGDPDFVWIVEENFADLPLTMLTLIQFATLDSVAAIYVPLIRKKPYLVMYFAGLIVVLGVVLMNLITAVVVNSALEQAMQDREMATLEFQKKKARCIRDVRALFRRMDTDNSGTITREEFTALMNEDTEDKAMVLQLVSIEEPAEIFDALDVSGGGEVCIDEFCDVLWTAFNNNGSIELKRTEKKLDQLRVMIEESMAHVERMWAGDAAMDAPRPLPRGVARAESGPSRTVLYGHRGDVSTAAPAPAEGEPASAGAEYCSENCKVSQSALPAVSTGAPPRDNANINSEHSWQGAEVPLPLWVNCMRQTLINELQVTRQMLVQEVQHACQGVHEHTASEIPYERPVHEAVRPHHHRATAVRTKRSAGSLPQGRLPEGPLAPRAGGPEWPRCLLGDVASNEPSVWRSCPSPSLPDPAKHPDLHQEPHTAPGVACNGRPPEDPGERPVHESVHLGLPPGHYRATGASAVRAHEAPSLGAS